MFALKIKTAIFLYRILNVKPAQIRSAYQVVSVIPVFCQPYGRILCSSRDDL